MIRQLDPNDGPAAGPGRDRTGRSTAACYAAAMIFALLCIGTALWSPTTLTPVPVLHADDLPCILTDRQLLDAIPAPTRGVLVEDNGITLHSVNRLSYRIELPTSGPVPIFFIAAGTRAGGRHASLTLHVDGNFQEEIFCTSREWCVYRANLDLSRGMHRLDLAFLNDFFFFPEDRNLAIRSLSIGTPLPDATRLYRWHAPVAIAPHLMSRQVYAELEPSTFRLWAGGHIADDVFFDTGGLHRIVLLAARLGADPRPAHVRLSVDRAQTACYAVASLDYTLFATDFNINSGLHRITIAAVKDGASAGDILLGGIAIDTQIIFNAAIRTTPIVTGNRTVLPGDVWDYAPDGNQREDGWVLWSNGCLQRELLCPAPFAGELVLTARADLCRGIGPSVLVMVDNDQIGRLDVGDSASQEYPLAITIPQGRHRLMLVFDNDSGTMNGEDRNLYVQSIALVRNSTSERPAADTAPGHCIGDPPHEP